MAGAGRRRVAARHPCRHVHEQGRGRDAPPHRNAAGPAFRAALDRHLPRHLPPPAAPALARGGPAAGFPDPRRRGPATPGQEDHPRPEPRRHALGTARSDVVHQRAEGRRPAAEAAEGRRRPDAPPADQAVRSVRGRLPPQRRRRFRRVAAAQLRDPARRSGPRRALPRALHARAGRRIPGHQHHPVRLDEGTGGLDQHPLRGGRRRPVDLPLARRAGREPAAVPQGFQRRAAVPARAELPLDRQHPRCRQRHHRQQQRPYRQEALDQRRQGRADPPLPRLQRARRGRVRHRQDPRVDRARRQACRQRHPLPLQRAVAGVRRIPARRAHSLPRVRRPAVLRAPGNQGRAGVPAPDLEPRRRCVVRARREPADARHRRAHPRSAAGPLPRARQVDVAVGRSNATRTWEPRRSRACRRS